MKWEAWILIVLFIVSSTASAMSIERLREPLSAASVFFFIIPINIFLIICVVRLAG